MEFLLFLSAKDKEIFDLIYKARFSVEENTPLCLIDKQFFGFLKVKQQRIVICTNNAKERGGYNLPRVNKFDDFDRTSLYIRKALRHEAVHVAQSCNNGKILELPNNKKMKLHPFKQKALEKSTSISGKRDKEYQAYWMEDKPKIVASMLRKYCL